MTKKPSPYQRIGVQDVASYLKVSYQTAAKHFNRMLSFYGKRERFLILKELAYYYHPDLEDLDEFLEEFGR
ncbi:hypothetical protein [Polaribacter sp.]|uniref:hypothetical protein n=1 Tax=Polaribacter sp. TaxID=1920175 RepID=UPI00404730FC